MNEKEHFKKLHNRLNDLKAQNEQFLKQREQLLRALNNKELADDIVEDLNVGNTADEILSRANEPNEHDPAVERPQNIPEEEVAIYADLGGEGELGNMPPEMFSKVVEQQQEVRDLYQPQGLNQVFYSPYERFAEPVEIPTVRRLVEQGRAIQEAT